MPPSATIAAASLSRFSLSRPVLPVEYHPQALSIHSVGSSRDWSVIVTRQRGREGGTVEGPTHIGQDYQPSNNIERAGCKAGTLSS